MLDAAASEGRVLVSPDVSTTPDHFRRFTQRRVSPGLILIPQKISVDLAIENVLTVCKACSAGDLENRICMLPGLVMYGF